MIIVCQCIERARADVDVVTLFEDEFTFYQQPSLANGWEMRGEKQPLARLGNKGNRKCRIAGVMNVVTGAVTFERRSKIGIKALTILLKRIRKQYATAKEINLIMDNWPIHQHPKVLRAAEENNIRLRFLPTYAPWTNPIEKLWRWLKQDILHLHHHAEDWKYLLHLVSNFLRNFKGGSEALLKYTGLSNGNIPSANQIWNDYINRENTTSVRNLDFHFAMPQIATLPV